MASPPHGILFCFILQSFWLLNSAEIRQQKAPSPTPWPLQFHALLFQNFSGSLAFIDLWYDWPKGSNFNIIHPQLGSTTYDLEWTNGTSFVYNLQNKTCRTLHVSVGILRPDWLDHATYLGVESVDGFKCNVWSKADGFIKYYEDIETKQPVHWLFFTGRAIHVLSFEVGRVLEDEEWQAPAYCFGESGDAVTGLKSSTSILKYEQRWLQSMEMTAMV